MGSKKKIEFGPKPFFPKKFVFKKIVLQKNFVRNFFGTKLDWFFAKTHQF